MAEVHIPARDVHDDQYGGDLRDADMALGKERVGKVSSRDAAQVKKLKEAMQWLQNVVQQ